MSLVLDALKRAEREQRKVQAPPLDQIISDVERSPLRVASNGWKIGLTTLLALPATLFILWWTLHPAESNIESIKATNEASHAPPVEPARLVSAAPVSSAVPDFVIEGHLWMPSNPSMARVFIDGKRYQVGDEPVPDLKLLAIGPDGVQFAWQGRLLTKAYP